jgi:hypothetical protein
MTIQKASRRTARATRARAVGLVSTVGVGYGFVHIPPLCLAILGLTVVGLSTVLVFGGYKVVDRILRHLEGIGDSYGAS